LLSERVINFLRICLNSRLRQKLGRHAHGRMVRIPGWKWGSQSANKREPWVLMHVVQDPLISNDTSKASRQNATNDQSKASARARVPN